MAVNSYKKGIVVRLKATFTTQATGSPIDPSTITLNVIDPGGTNTQYNYSANIQRDGVGLYHYDLAVTTLIGDYAYRWSSTGTGQAAAEGVFSIDPSRF